MLLQSLLFHIHSKKKQQQLGDIVLTSTNIFQIFQIGELHAMNQDPVFDY